MTTGTQILTAKCCNSPGKNVTINVVLPEPDRVGFGPGGGRHEIYGVAYADPVWERVNNPNEPVCYTMKKKLNVEASFWASEHLSYNTMVEVDVKGTQGASTLTFAKDIFVLRGTWPSWEWLTWPAGPTTHISDDNLPNTIGPNSLTFTWYYRVPSGTNAWVTMANTSGPHKIYRVYGEPLCASTLYTKANLETCVTWASGCTKVDTSNDADNIPRKVQLGAKNWHAIYGSTSTGIKDDPFTWIPAHKGDCITYADLMTKGLLLLGITASSEYIECKSVTGTHYFYTPDLTPYWVTGGGDADGDGTINSSESGYPGTLEGIYVVGSDPTHDAAWRAANAPWNFHGASSAVSKKLG